MSRHENLHKAAEGITADMLCHYFGSAVRGFPRSAHEATTRVYAPAANPEQHAQRIREKYTFSGAHDAVTCALQFLDSNAADELVFSLERGWAGVLPMNQQANVMKAVFVAMLGQNFDAAYSVSRKLGRSDDDFQQFLLSGLLRLISDLPPFDPKAAQKGNSLGLIVDYPPDHPLQGSNRVVFMKPKNG